MGFVGMGGIPVFDIVDVVVVVLLVAGDGVVGVRFGTRGNLGEVLVVDDGDDED